MTSEQTAKDAPQARHIPPGVDLPAMVQTMPWLTDWLLPPDVNAQTYAAPRDFIRTPYALVMLDRKRQEATFLDGVNDAWEALQRVTRRLLARHVGWIGAYSPLHRCIILDQAGAAMDAIPTAGPSLHRIGPHGHTALTLAAMLGHNTLADILLANGVGVNNADILGNTPLHWACIMRNYPLMQRLLQLGADTEVANLFGGFARDYDDGWNRIPPTQLEMEMRFADGRIAHVTDQASFRELMQFDLLPLARPGVDFYTQMILGMLQPKWVERAVQELTNTGTFGRHDFVDLPLYLKDFGEPFGWGVCTYEPIAKGTPVTGYVGDLVHTFEVTVDLFNYGFTLYTSNTQPSDSMQQLFLSHFDGRRSGNLGSRINSAHVREAASLEYMCRFCKGLPTSMFFASRDIAAGEQISWFYGDGYWRARGIEAQPLPLF